MRAFFFFKYFFCLSKDALIGVDSAKMRSAGTSSAPTVYALDNLPLLQLGFRDSANAVGGEVSVSGLDASEAAEVFVALFLPLGDQVAVGDLVLDTVLVKF